MHVGCVIWLFFAGEVKQQMCIYSCVMFMFAGSDNLKV